MLSTIAQGNAAEDGKNFRHWFVGDIQWWCKRDNIHFDPSRFRLQNTTTLEMKWTVLKKGEKRPGGWAHPSEKTSITILVRGQFIIEFRDPTNASRCIQYKLANEGDYAIWPGNVEHFWWAEDDTVTITVRWVDNTRDKPASPTESGC